MCCAKINKQINKYKIPSTNSLSAFKHKSCRTDAGGWAKAARESADSSSSPVNLNGRNVRGNYNAKLTFRRGDPRRRYLRCQLADKRSRFSRRLALLCDSGRPAGSGWFQLDSESGEREKTMLRIYLHVPQYSSSISKKHTA